MVLIPIRTPRMEVPAPMTVLVIPETSQSPAVKLTEVTLEAEPLVRLTAKELGTEAVTTSPILPTEALSFVVVPGIWPVALKSSAKNTKATCGAVVKLIADDPPAELKIGARVRVAALAV